MKSTAPDILQMENYRLPRELQPKGLCDWDQATSSPLCRLPGCYWYLSIVAAFKHAAPPCATERRSKADDNSSLMKHPAGAPRLFFLAQQPADLS